MTGRELDLLQGTLDFLVLRALAWKSLHGYAVARFIEEHSDGTFRVLDGALYAALHRMEHREWITAEWGLSDKGKRARFYTLTGLGREALRTQRASWALYVEAVGKVMRAKPRAA